MPPDLVAEAWRYATEALHQADPRIAAALLHRGHAPPDRKAMMLVADLLEQAHQINAALAEARRRRKGGRPNSQADLVQWAMALYPLSYAAAKAKHGARKAHQMALEAIAEELARPNAWHPQFIVTPERLRKLLPRKRAKTPP